MTFSSTSNLVIHASRDRVWQALTDPALVKQYFFGTDLDTTWKVGAPLTFRGEWQGKTYEDRGTVLAFEPGRSLSYSYWSSFSDTPDTPDTRQIVRYDLSDEGDGVRLTVTQSNVDTQERADHSAENWQTVFGGLKKLVEKR